MKKSSQFPSRSLGFVGDQVSLWAIPQNLFCLFFSIEAPGNACKCSRMDADAVHHTAAPILCCWLGHSSQSCYSSVSTADVVFGPKVCQYVTVETDLEQSRKFNFPVSSSSSSFGRKVAFSLGIQTYSFIKQAGHAVSVGPE